MPWNRYDLGLLLAVLMCVGCAPLGSPESLQPEEVDAPVPEGERPPEPSAPEAPAPGIPAPEPEPVAALRWAHESPEGYDSDVYRWRDASGQPREAVLTRNEARDPGGSHGGMLRRLRFHVGGQERVATGTGAHGLWNGWGYVVSHYNDGEAVSHSAALPGAWRQVFLGAHHALHEFSWMLPIGGKPVRVTVQWLFATGRDHPLYAVTFDSSAAGPAGLPTRADSRTPYGDIAWDGDGAQAWVDGVRWGDQYRFASHTEPLTAASGWDYRQPNRVPHVAVYSRAADAQMGMVQTLDWVHHDAGGSWFHDNWGHDSETRVHGDVFLDWRMPPAWNWPYQVCQYELDSRHPTRSKRLAWGLMYGAVGSPVYSGYGAGRLLKGHPYQSYSLFVILGRVTQDAVREQVEQVERLLQARLTVSQGQAVEEGPGGVARSDREPRAASGYNSVYAAHELRADAAGAFSLSLDAVGGALDHPLFLVRGLKAAPSRLLLDGEPLRADVEAFTSFDAATGTLWLTLAGRWSGRHTLAGVSGGGERGATSRSR